MGRGPRVAGRVQVGIRDLRPGVKDWEVEGRALRVRWVGRWGSGGSEVSGFGDRRSGGWKVAPVAGDRGQGCGVRRSGPRIRWRGSGLRSGVGGGVGDVGGGRRSRSAVRMSGGGRGSGAPADRERGVGWVSGAVAGRGGDRGWSWSGLGGWRFGLGGPLSEIRVGARGVGVGRWFWSLVGGVGDPRSDVGGPGSGDRWVRRDQGSAAGDQGVRVSVVESRRRGSRGWHLGSGLRG